MTRPISPALEHLLERSRAEGRFTAAQFRDVREAITSSPKLAHLLEQLSAEGALDRLSLRPAGNNIGGTYSADRKEISLSAGLWSGNLQPRERIDRLTYVLGHEAGHGVVREATVMSRQQLSQDVYRAVQRHENADITRAVETYVGYQRRNEAIAESFGWEALQSRVQTELGRPPSHDDMIRRAAPVTACVQGEVRSPRLAPGITLSANSSLYRATADGRPELGTNAEAMSRCFFDRPADPALSQGLGGSYDYRHVAAADAISVATHIMNHDYHYRRSEHQTLRLDLEKLGLDPRQLERAGLDLGGEGRTVRYENVRDGRPAGAGVLTDQGVRLRNTPRLTDALDAPQVTEQQQQAPDRGFATPLHPQHALYRELKAVLPSETSEDRLSQITAQAHIGGVQAGQIRDVHVNEGKVHVLGEVPGQRAHIDLSQSPPAQAHSQQQVVDHDQQQGQRQQQFQQEQAQQQQSAQAQRVH